MLTRAQKEEFIFGAVGDYYQTESEALGNMSVISVPVWKYNSTTKTKYASKMNLQVNTKLVNSASNRFCYHNI